MPLTGLEPHLLAHLVAESTSFQQHIATWHGVTASAAEVVKHVHIPSAETLSRADGGEAAKLPWAIIHDEGATLMLDNQGVSNWRGTGTLWLSLDLALPVDLYDEPYLRHHRWFVTLTGNIIDEMRQKVDDRSQGPLIDGVQYGSHLAVHSFNRVNNAPFEIDPDEMHLTNLETEVPCRIWHDRYEVSFY